MQDPRDRTGAMLGQWSEIALANLERMSKARRLARQNEYGPAHLVSDCIASWWDLWELWVPGSSADPDGVPLVAIPVSLGDDAASAATVVPVKQDDPTATPLVYVGVADGGAREIPRDNVQVALEGYVLRIRLLGLSRLGLVAGRYRGLVLEGDGEDVLALVYVDLHEELPRMDAEPDPLPPPGSRRKKEKPAKQKKSR